MGIISKIFGGGGGAQPMPMPTPPPVAPPAYSMPTPADAAGNQASAGARAAGAYGNTIITGPTGLTKPETTSNKKLTGE